MSGATDLKDQLSQLPKAAILVLIPPLCAFKAATNELRMGSCCNNSVSQQYMRESQKTAP